MTCEQARQAWHDRMESPAGQAPFEACVPIHLEACAECRAYYERMNRLVAGLEGLRLRNERDFEVLREHRVSRAVVVCSDKRAGWRDALARFRPLALAAALLLAASAWLMTQRRHHGAEDALVDRTSENRGIEHSPAGRQPGFEPGERFAESGSTAVTQPDRPLRVAREIKLLGPSGEHYLAVTESTPAADGVRVFWLFNKSQPADTTPA